MESVGGMIMGKWENSENTPKNPDLVHHKYHSAAPEITSVVSQHAIATELSKWPCFITNFSKSKEISMKMKNFS
mgnify:CR=1 FL=1